MIEVASLLVYNWRWASSIRTMLLALGIMYDSERTDRLGRVTGQVRGERRVEEERGERRVEE